MKESLKSTFIGVLLASLTILFGIIVSILGEKLGYSYLLLSLAAIVIIALGSIFISAIFAARQEHLREEKAWQDIDSRLARLDRCIDKLCNATGLQEILSQEDLMEKERYFEAGEVWVVTTDLSNDVPGGGIYFDIVEQNLRRNIKYHFFAPDTGLIKARKEHIANALKNWKDLIYWVLLPEDLFKLHIGRNVGIYIPDHTLRREEEAYAEIRFGHNVIRWARLDRELTIELIGHLQSAAQVH